MEEISYSGGRSPIRKKLSKRVLLFGLFSILILVLLGGVIYFVTRDSSKEEVSKTITLPENSSPAVSETPTPTEEVSPTPEKSATPSKAPTKAASSASTAKSDINVRVENGSGESGVAGKASEVLKTAGYTVASTGNANNFDYTDVTIKIKSSQKSNLAIIEKDLSTDYTIGDTSTDLSEDETYDVLVIIGK
ncbi:MAG: LytR C-terminal domain-containing protein [Patescibacteria group bacterium]